MNTSQNVHHQCQTSFDGDVRGSTCCEDCLARTLHPRYELGVDPSPAAFGHLGGELVGDITAERPVLQILERRRQSREHRLSIYREALDSRRNDDRVDLVDIFAVHQLDVDAADELGLVGHGVTASRRTSTAAHIV
ncbi:hypothetical protein CH296_01040 [Rhodococcus sp. 14-2496-1d]|nr:hypothetical protein CH296_01040 [Rhodococcus sp. 14-2496-1d]